MSNQVRESLAVDIAQLLKKSKQTEDGKIDRATERKLDEMIDKAVEKWEG